jgi:hypothetical protein
MDRIIISLTQLRGMIGQRVIHEGLRCLVVEVLEQDLEIVLQVEEHHSIQPDQYGEARRIAPDTLTIPVLSADRTELHAIFLSLELL